MTGLGSTAWEGGGWEGTSIEWIFEELTLALVFFSLVTGLINSPAVWEAIVMHVDMQACTQRGRCTHAQTTPSPLIAMYEL